jgi:DNA-binding transcriptional LysR family regulator
MSRLAPRAQLDIIAWHENAFEETARGRIDAVLWPNKAPPPLRSEVVLLTEIVCVMSADHPLARRRSLTIEGYLSYPHVMVTVLATARTLVDDQLVAGGHNRRIGLRVPYYVSAVLAVEKTTLIATVPRAAAQLYARGARVRIMPPPIEFEPVRILMSWHPSSDSEAALRWFRELVGGVAKGLA